MKDLLPVFRDIKNIKCPLRRMRKKRTTVRFPQVHEMCLKSHVARLDPFSMMFSSRRCGWWKSAMIFTTSWHNWSTLCQLWQLAKADFTDPATKSPVPIKLTIRCWAAGRKPTPSLKTHAFTNAHRVTNSANVRWCIKSSAGLAVPLRPGLRCQCKSRFRNLQAPVEHPSSLCSGVVSCKFLHHHPGAQTVCAEGWQGINAIFTPPVFRG